MEAPPRRSGRFASQPSPAQQPTADAHQIQAVIAGTDWLAESGSEYIVTGFKVVHGYPAFPDGVLAGYTSLPRLQGLVVGQLWDQRRVVSNAGLRTVYEKLKDTFNISFDGAAMQQRKVEVWDAEALCTALTMLPQYWEEPGWRGMRGQVSPAGRPVPDA
jgi:hypothetical protein